MEKLSLVKNISKNIILLFHISYRACCNNQLIIFFTKLDYFFIYFYNLIFISYRSIFQIISKNSHRLYLEKIKKFANFFYFFFRKIISYSLKQKTVFAARAYYQTFFIFFYQIKRRFCFQIKIFHPRFWNYFIKIFKSMIIFGKNNWWEIFVTSQRPFCFYWINFFKT